MTLLMNHKGPHLHHDQGTWGAICAGQEGRELFPHCSTQSPSATHCSPYLLTEPETIP